MTSYRDALAALRPSLAATALCLAASILAVLAGRHMMHKAESRLAAAQEMRAEAAIRLARVREEEIEIRDKGRRYDALVARRIVGPELRLRWIEAMETARLRRGLFAVHYEIDAQRVLHDDDDGSGHRFLASAMRMKIELLHEADLTGFLADLRQSVPAEVIVRRCRISRLPASGDGNHAPGLTPNLLAECETDWITIEKSGKP